MKNKANFNTLPTSFNAITFFKFNSNIWIIDVVFTVVLFFTTLYFVIALLHHLTKTEKNRQKTYFQLPLEKRFSVLSKYTCICIAFVTLLRNLNRIGLLVMDGVTFFSSKTKPSTVEAEIACNVLARTTNFLLAVCKSLVYWFWWLRQSIFYIQPHLKVLNKKYVRIFSVSILIFYFVIGVSLFVVYLITSEYKTNETGFCYGESKIGSDNWSYSTLILVLTGLSISMQIALLMLFINPLLKRPMWKNAQQLKRSCRLIRRVKKAIVLALICIGTDILAFSINLLLFEKHSNRVSFPYSVNLFIHCSVVIACFDCWKQILWPWKSKSQAANSKQTLTISSTTRSVPLSNQ